MDARTRVATISVIAVVIAVVLAYAYVSDSDHDTAVQASDYSDVDNWMRLPGSIEHEVDVIYLYPTTFVPGYDGEECTIYNADMREKANMIYERQATVFNGLANIFAPYYRQIDAASLAGLTQPEMVERESGEPRADVFAALDYYFENHNDGRPFILAGHSQGSMMIMIILDEYMERHPEVYDRMVAAYMIGNAATKDWLAANSHVRMATGATDNGVVVSWNTEGPGNIGHYNMVVPGGGSVCINPLNWSTDGTYAGTEDNLGCLTSDGNGGYRVVEGFADARVDLDRGSVIVESVDPEVYSNGAEALFGPQSYHGQDYDFFYMNIRENAGDRIEAFLSG
ncbi:DUF3089 domain-containing protein [Candidatus Methanoprimaticola sp. MG2]|uniref:DUF3089 domain-containing protein n=1 Tax=Candidatus Methanoprimaticola sp. MG2 TaxID=3228838 RepID=UPI0039C656C1